MTILMIAAAVAMVAGLIGTLALSGRGDEQYTSATKGNLTRLVLIDAGLAIVLAVRERRCPPSSLDAAAPVRDGRLWTIEPR
ncbi:hypothetical protein HNR34_000832 [Geobacillus subterraneus]